MPTCPGSPGAPHMPPCALLLQALKQRQRARKNRRKCPSPEKARPVSREGNRPSQGKGPQDHPAALGLWGLAVTLAGIGEAQSSQRLSPLHPPGLQRTCSLRSMGREWVVTQAPTPGQPRPTPPQSLQISWGRFWASSWWISPTPTPAQEVGPRKAWRAGTPRPVPWERGSQGRGEGWSSMQNWRYWGTCGWA